MSIQTYVRPYAKLKKAGRDFICACPFHETSAYSRRLMPSAEYFECSESGRQGNTRDLRRRLSERPLPGRLCV